MLTFFFLSFFFFLILWELICASSHCEPCIDVVRCIQIFKLKNELNLMQAFLIKHTGLVS